MIDPSGKLLTGEAATKRLTEMGFARSESTKPKETSTASSGSYTWEAPPDVMDEMMQQVRQQLASEQTQEEQVLQRRKTSPPRQSMIQEWTEEQLLSILVELSSDSPEANALLRDVQERVEEYFDLERFPKNLTNSVEIPMYLQEKWKENLIVLVVYDFPFIANIVF